MKTFNIRIRSEYIPNWDNPNSQLRGREELFTTFKVKANKFSSAMGKLSKLVKSMNNNKNFRITVEEFIE